MVNPYTAPIAVIPPRIFSAMLEARLARAAREQAAIR